MECRKFAQNNENKGNLKTKMKVGTTFNLCVKDFHLMPVWRPCPNCLSKQEWKEKFFLKKYKKKSKISKDFKILLIVLL